jgi:hypothetical protein
MSRWNRNSIILIGCPAHSKLVFEWLQINCIQITKDASFRFTVSKLSFIPGTISLIGTLVLIPVSLLNSFANSFVPFISSTQLLRGHWHCRNLIVMEYCISHSKLCIGLILNLTLCDARGWTTPSVKFSISTQFGTWCCSAWLTKFQI